MTASLDIVIESPASVEQVHAAFRSEDYWRARLVAFGDTSTLDSLTVDADDTVTVRLTQHLGRQLLPGGVATLVPGDLKIVRTETWTPISDRRVCGKVSVSSPAGLGSGRAEAWLTPAGSGSQLRFAATVKVKVPLVGGKLEKVIAGDLAENLSAFVRFTAAWIAEHPAHQAGSVTADVPTNPATRNGRSWRIFRPALRNLAPAGGEATSHGGRRPGLPACD
jgi:hypothetical protein